MIPWMLIDTATLPASSETLSLYRRGDEFSIRGDGFELMNSRRHGSEVALAQMACQRISGHQRPRILIGGLGMGYTLAAALEELDADSSVVVAELVPAVVQWNRGPLAHLAGNPLADGRAAVREIDIAEDLKSSRAKYDAILLDVDNGPDGLTRKANDWLYSNSGLKAAFKALRFGGILAVWSAASDRSFTQRLRRIGLQVEEVWVPARGRKGGRHTIWLATRDER